MNVVYRSFATHSCLRRCSDLRVGLLNLKSHLLLQSHDLESLEVGQVTPPVLHISLLRPA